MKTKAELLAVEAGKERAREALRQGGHFGRAAALRELQACFRVDPEDPEVLGLLGEAIERCASAIEASPFLAGLPFPEGYFRGATVGASVIHLRRTVSEITRELTRLRARRH